MEKQIKEKFNDTILQEAMARYGIAEGQIRLLDGFESFIFEFDQGGQEYILRIAHSSRRNHQLIQGEVDWINYLVAGGVSASEAILSQNKLLVEAIDDRHDGDFLATAFVKAKGKPPWEVGWTTQLFENYGKLIGKIHALTQHYIPSPQSERPHWNGNLMLDVEKNLPASEERVLEKYKILLDYLNALPQEADAYGLVHYDAHVANLFIDTDGTITLFDFDDCAYSWFINDIAIVLFYMITNKDDAKEVTQKFMTHFLKGYAQENHLNPKWLKEIPYFLKLREIDLYAVIHRSFDVDEIDHSWCARFMQDRKYKIEHDLPYVDFDFESLSKIY